jgi:ubiquinone/menaquinone biosynthesis C-methylase UbiE
VSTSYQAKEYYQDESVAMEYDRVRFRGIRGALVDRLEQRLLKRSMAGLRPAARVLDLPIGTGRMARRLAAAGHQVVGADVSVPMLRVARELGSEGETAHHIVRGDAEGLPFADNSFNVAVCFRLLSHLPTAARRKVLREMARVAGDRVIAVYQPHKVAAWWLLNGLLLRRPLPRYFVSPDELKREFAVCGLRPVRSHALLRGVFMERAYVLEPVASG